MGEGRNVYIRIRNSKYKSFRMMLFSAKSSQKVVINDAVSGHKVEYRKQDDVSTGVEIIEIDILNNNVLLEISVTDTITPVYDLEHNNDYRNLGICFLSFEIISGQLEQYYDELSVDINQTDFLTENFQYGYVHDKDFYYLENFSHIENMGIFLDVGANIGQSACSIANVHPSIKIYCFEPNRLLEPNIKIVKSLLGSRMDYEMCGISDVKSERDFYIPSINGVIYSQEGTFDRSELDTVEAKSRMIHGLSNNDVQIEIKSVKFPTRTMEKDCFESYFVKIDVQGWEYYTLKGMQSVLSEYRPIILIEKGGSINDILLNIPGYSMYYYDYIERKFITDDTHTANYFLIHKQLTSNDVINHQLYKMLENPTS